MSESARWFGILALFALLVYSKSGGGVLPITDPKADKLWIVSLDDIATRKPAQTIALDASRWEAPNVSYEHYWKPSTEADKYKSISKYADELIVLNADTGKTLAVVEIPEKPTADWPAAQIARFAK